MSQNKMIKLFGQTVEIAKIHNPILQSIYRSESDRETEQNDQRMWRYGYNDIPNTYGPDRYDDWSESSARKTKKDSGGSAAGGGIVGAIIGGLIGGPVGVIIGGLIGAGAGASSSDKDKK